MIEKNDEQICCHSKRPHTITEMNNNISMACMLCLFNFMFYLYIFRLSSGLSLKGNISDHKNVCAELFSSEIYEKIAIIK
jgi:hypothetical protein